MKISEISNNSYRYVFTVFTPAYNRAHTLARVYESLKHQTFKDFEWLIVDDGSTDNTRKIVEEWCHEATFPIRYFWQENCGKPCARNLGVVNAQGELFFTLDSDDKCVPRAFELMKNCWDSIPEEMKGAFAGVAGLCAYEDGSIVGSKFPYNVFDSNMYEIREKYKVVGEKCGFQRTDVMKEYPFPVFEGEKFITEAVVWYRIAKKYKTRFFNEVLRIYFFQPDGLSTASLMHLIESPKSNALFYKEYLTMPLHFPAKQKVAINYVRTSLHAGQNVVEIIKNTSSKIYVLVGFPVGVALFFRDRIAFRKQSVKL